jgi:hypothetical protein
MGYKIKVAIWKTGLFGGMGVCFDECLENLGLLF